MAVTVTYEHPVAGLVPPTFAQVATEVAANVIADADGDAAAVIVHNMGLPAAELAAGFPDVLLEPGQAEPVAARLSAWMVGAKTADQVTINKAAGVGGSGAAGIQLRVKITRPHSIVK